MVQTHPEVEPFFPEVLQYRTVNYLIIRTCLLQIQPYPLSYIEYATAISDIITKYVLRNPHKWPRCKMSIKLNLFSHTSGGGAGRRSSASPVAAMKLYHQCDNLPHITHVVIWELSAG